MPAMTSASARTSATRRRLVLVPDTSGRRADDAVRRFRLAHRRVEPPMSRLQTPRARSGLAPRTRD
jgi:hypothetical protein